MNLPANLTFLSPSQSLILDFGDKNWSSVFSEEELDELRGAGSDLPCGVPKELEQYFEGLTKLVYTYRQTNKEAKDMTIEYSYYYVL